MKKFLTILFLCFSALSMQAQSKTPEIVYLKNGSMIRGTVLEMVAGQNIRIQTSDGSIYVYPADEVERIVQDKALDEDTSLEVDKGESSLKKGFRALAEFGINDMGDNDTEMLSATLAVGYQFSPHIFLGVGAGLHNWDDDNALTMPIFVNFRADFIETKITPFFDMKVGYSTLEEGMNGAYLSLGLGCRFRLYHRLGLSLSAGYHAQDFTNMDWAHCSHYRNGEEYAGGAFLRIGVDL